jgi:hypothetical protein
MTIRPVPPSVPWFSIRAKFASVPGLSPPYQLSISLTLDVAISVFFQFWFVVCQFAFFMFHPSAPDNRVSLFGRRVAESMGQRILDLAKAASRISPHLQFRQWGKERSQGAAIAARGGRLVGVS